MQVSVQHRKDVDNPKPDKRKGNKNPEFKGSDYCLKIFDNGAVVGPTGSGKSIVIRHLIKKFAGPETQIHLFCPTADVCETWEETLKRLRKKKMEVIHHSSVYNKDDKKAGSFLTKFLADKKDEKAKGKGKEKGQEPVKLNQIEMLALEREEDKLDDEGYEEEKRKWPKEKGKEYPPYLFIFDDISGQIRDKDFMAFLKECRHYGIKCIISSQGWMDFGVPDQRNQIHWVCMMRSLPERSITQIQRDLSIPLDPKLLYKIYLKLSEQADKFPFMYACPIKRDYRQYYSEFLNYDDLLGGIARVEKSEPKRRLGRS